MAKESGWGEDVIVKTKMGYECYIFEGNILIETFRTDCKSFKDLIRSEAERYIDYLKNKSPDKSYRLEDNFKEVIDYFS